MRKIAVGPKAKGCIDLEASVETNLRAVAKALNKDINDLTLIIQDRERHEDIIKEARKVGCRIKLFSDGDVATAIATCFEDTGIDIFMGIGGAPEGVIAAAAIKGMGGEMQGKIIPLYEEDAMRCEELGWTKEKREKLLTLDDLVNTDDVLFVATGATDGELLKGVTYLENNKARTQSDVIRSKTGTIRFVDAIHKLDKNDALIETLAKHK
jgi:fructose-1,6-bisphosphatase II